MALSKESLRKFEEDTTECSVILGSSSSGNFDQVIVYLKAHKYQDGYYTSLKGQFRIFEMKDVVISSPLNDFMLDGEMYETRHGTSVRPVSVRVRDETFLRAALFARVRKGAQMSWLKAIVQTLNNNLEKYKDHLRDAIAQEWCSQEHWRIFPSKRGTKYPDQYEAGNMEILKSLMREMLPMGYDADCEM